MTVKEAKNIVLAKFHDADSYRWNWTIADASPSDTKVWIETNSGTVLSTPFNLPGDAWLDAAERLSRSCEL
jgi:hypothetical protein